MVLFKQYKDFENTSALKKKKKNQQAVFRMEVPFRLNKLRCPCKNLLSLLVQCRSLNKLMLQGAERDVCCLASTAPEQADVSCIDILSA